MSIHSINLPLLSAVSLLLTVPGVASAASAAGNTLILPWSQTPGLGSFSWLWLFLL